MDDKSIIHHIQHLVDEEHQLDQKGDRSPDDHQRYQALKVELDQCWDLLRQRRARREFGEDADQATVRDPKVVESYEQ
ncbi:MAG TPA: DUF2630 family protein [Thermoanaerobaculia bacterium]|jgi:hypothetical protein|nr:DUF2630 family protein [Thermoanaerobaculia bacterium]